MCIFIKILVTAQLSFLPPLLLWNLKRFFCHFQLQIQIFTFSDLACSWGILYLYMHWYLLGLVTDTEKKAVFESSGITRMRRWWRPTRLVPTLGINLAIVFALPARPSCQPSHVFIYCEQFYNSQQLCCHLLSYVCCLVILSVRLYWFVSFPRRGCFLGV